MATLSTPRNPSTLRLTHWLSALAFAILFGSGAALYNHRPSFRLAHGTLTLPRIPVFLAIGVFPKPLHYVFAALFVLAGVVYFVWGARNGHFARMIPSRRDIAAAPAMIAYYLRLRKTAPTYERYNPLQQLAYASVLFVLTPLIVLTGAAMLPIAAFHPLGAIFIGGVKLWHFTCIALLTLFGIGHLIMVLTTGVRTNLRTML